MAEKSTSQNDQFEHDQLHHREARAKPRPDQPSVVLGSPRVSRPLDFEYYPRVFKIQNPGARFRDRRIWRDRSVTDTGTPPEV